jgi:hypothetical protein
VGPTLELPLGEPGTKVAHCLLHHTYPDNLCSPAGYPCAQWRSSHRRAAVDTRLLELVGRQSAVRKYMLQEDTITVMEIKLILCDDSSLCQ